MSLPRLFPISPVTGRPIRGLASRASRFAAALMIASAAAACGGGGSTTGGGGGSGAAGATGASTAGDATAGVSTSGADATDAGLSAAAALGKSIFADAGLSGSGRVACSSCHDPARAHGAAFETAGAPGGASLDRVGGRKAPSIRYLRFAPAFSVDAGGAAVGGLFWDGRAATLEEQAAGPFLNPDEMANDSVEALVARLRAAPYAARFEAVFGSGVWSDPQVAFARMRSALAAYQREDPDFAPFSSKYDAFLAGRATLAAAELRGLALFASPSKGNCAACHPSQRGADGRPPLFTDFSYDALGVPRNGELPRNADPAAFDLGLCASPRGAALGDAACGRFRVPSLRNVALARRLFHNGRFASLKEAVSFYATRDADPARWYPAGADGRAVAYDDLPAALRGNVNRSEVPYGRLVPTLSESEIDDIVAFLGTLTDGWTPP